MLHWEKRDFSNLKYKISSAQLSSVQSFSHVRLFATPWITQCQASLSITNSRSLLKLMSIESVMPSSHLIHCRPLLLLLQIPPSIRVNSDELSQLFAWGGPSIGVSASASVLPMNTQDWSPLGWTGWISLQSKGLSRVFSNSTVQKHRFFGAQPTMLLTIETLFYNRSSVLIHLARLKFCATGWHFLISLSTQTLVTMLCSASVSNHCLLSVPMTCSCPNLPIVKVIRIGLWQACGK